MHLDIGLPHLDDAFCTWERDVVVRALRGVHEEVPVPAEVRELLGLEVQDAVLVLDGGGAPGTLLESSIIFFQSFHLGELFQPVQNVEGAVHQPSLLLQEVPIAAKVCPHFGELDVSASLDRHVGKVKIEAWHSVCEGGKLLHCQPRPHGAVASGASLWSAQPHLAHPAVEVASVEVPAAVREARGEDEVARSQAFGTLLW
mmetsp:Transcript_122955/g.358883  ORF Transcript_122955/g.358883 Transcript_122955/m.358883 type:complete len:201 (+) Transcript_122955:2970-3572(+)